LGCVVQAYRKDSYADLRDLVAWSKGALQIPLQIRLVKGAYWDYETVVAKAEGWPVPVFEEKAQTDANYERCVRHLIDNAGAVRRPSDPANPGPFDNEPPAELRRITPRARLVAAVGATPGELGFDAPVLIGGKPVRTREEIVSVDPGAYSTVVARSGRAGSAEVEAAVAAASAAGREWRALGFAGRAA